MVIFIDYNFEGYSFRMPGPKKGFHIAKIGNNTKYDMLILVCFIKVAIYMFAINYE